MYPMTWLPSRIMAALLILASLALPGSMAECNTEDGVLTINLDDLGIYLDGCRGGDDCHDDHHDDCHGDCHGDGFFDFWWYD
jgi:hypothetical protein